MKIVARMMFLYCVFGLHYALSYFNSTDQKQNDTLVSTSIKRIRLLCDYVKYQKNGSNKRFPKQKRTLLKGGKNPLFWKLYNAQKFKTKEEVIRQDIYDAFKLWTSANPDFKFIETFGYDSDIKISFEKFNHTTDNFSFDGENGVLGHAFFPGTDLEGVVHFDEDEIWEFNASRTKTENSNLSNSVKFFHVVVHELGHALGLFHSLNKKSVMYEFYQDIDLIKMPVEDSFAIKFLYKNNVTTAATLPNIVASTTPQIPPQTGEKTCSIASVAKDFEIYDKLILDLFSLRVRKASKFRNTSNFFNTKCSHGYLIKQILATLQKYSML